MTSSMTLSPYKNFSLYYCDVIMGAMESQITSLTIVYSAVYSGTHQRKHQSSASLAFVRGTPMTGQLPAQRASKAENVSICGRHHGIICDDLFISAVVILRSRQAFLPDDHHFGITVNILSGNGSGIWRYNQDSQEQALCSVLMVSFLAQILTKLRWFKIVTGF